MARSTRPEPSIELLDTDGPAAVSDDSLVRRGLSGWWWLPALLAAAVGLGALLRPPAADQVDPGPPPSDPARSTIPVGPAPPPVVPDPVTIEPPLADGVAELAELGVPLRAVITSTSRSAAVLVEVDRVGGVTMSDVPVLSDYAFDRSGRWLAGISHAQVGRPRSVLWAGPAGGELAPVDVGVGSFAWHDGAVGRLAWTPADSDQVRFLDLTADEWPTSIDLATSGRLKGWGSWGFAIQTSNRSFTTSFLDREGRLMAEDLSGRFVGRVPRFGLLLTGGVERPLLVDPVRWVTRPVPWLDETDFVWRLSVATDRRRIVVLVGKSGLAGDAFLGEVTVVTHERVVNGQPVVGQIPASRVLATTGAVTDVGWAFGGAAVVYVTQEPSGSQRSGAIALVLGDRTPIEVPLPDLFEGREWVAALAVG